MIFTNWRNISKLLLGGMLLFATACENGDAGKGVESQDDVATALLCDPATYDLECMKSEQTSASDALLDAIGGIKKEIINVAGGDVPDERQDEYGDNSRKEIEREFSVIAGHPKLPLLNGLMRKLLKLRRNTNMKNLLPCRLSKN